MNLIPLSITGGQGQGCLTGLRDSTDHEAMADDRAERLFSIQEVNALIPAMGRLVDQQILRQARINEAMQEVESLLGHEVKGLQDLEAESGDSVELTGKKSALVGELRRYEQGWVDVQALGAVVKDPLMGLCDFRGIVGGEVVWLCWMQGETELGYYHPLDEGFSGRLPLPEGHKPLLH